MKLSPFFEKNIVLVGISLSVIAIFIAMMLYAGGTPNNPNTIGYSFSENYISNLLEDKALNGEENKSRLWAIIGVLLMGVSTGLAFVRFSRKIDLRKYSVVIKSLGLALILINILITIPALHDLMVTIGSISTLLLYFYMMLLLLKSKLTVLKILSVLFLIFYYGAAYMYFTRTALDYMPIVQKMVHIIQIVFIIGIEYFTSKQDFEQIKN